MTRKPRLTSGSYGSGGRATSGMGGAHITGTHKGRSARRERPYLVVGTTAGDYTTHVANNTNRIFRDER